MKFALFSVVTKDWVFDFVFPFVQIKMLIEK